jgi:hypothetical protein
VNAPRRWERGEMSSILVVKNNCMQVDFIYPNKSEMLKREEKFYQSEKKLADRITKTNEKKNKIG